MDAKRGWARVGRALVSAIELCAAGCACTVVEGPDDEPHGCFAGERCPDGSCVAQLILSDDFACCGAGGECPPCGGAAGHVQCEDGTCVTSWKLDACCAHGGACLPDDASSSTDATPPATSDTTDATSTSESSTSADATTDTSTSDTT